MKNVYAPQNLKDMHARVCARVDACVDACVHLAWRSPQGHSSLSRTQESAKTTWTCVTAVCIDMLRCIDMCIDMFIEIYVYMCIDMCIGVVGYVPSTDEKLVVWSIFSGNQQCLKADVYACPHRRLHALDHCVEASLVDFADHCFQRHIAPSAQ